MSKVLGRKYCCDSLYSVLGTGNPEVAESGMRSFKVFEN